MLLAAKFFEMFPEHNEYGVISQFLCFELVFCCFRYNEEASAVNAVSSNPCVDPLPRIKIPLFVLLICTDSSSYQLRK